MASQLTQLNVLLQPASAPVGGVGVKSPLLSGGALVHGSLPASVSSEFSALLKEMGLGNGRGESGSVLPVTGEGINLPLEGQELPYLAAVLPYSPLPLENTGSVSLSESPVLLGESATAVNAEDATLVAPGWGFEEQSVALLESAAVAADVISAQEVLRVPLTQVTLEAQTAQVTLGAQTAQAAQVALETQTAQAAQVTLEAQTAQTAQVTLEAQAAQTAQVTLEAQATQTAQVTLEAQTAQTAQTAQVALKAQVAQTAQVTLEAQAAQTAQVALKSQTAQAAQVTLEAQTAQVAQAAQTDQAARKDQTALADIASQQMRSSSQAQSTNAQTKNTGVQSIISQSVVDDQRKGERSRAETSLPSGIAKMGAAQQRGVNASVAPLVASVGESVNGVNENQAAILQMPLVQKKDAPIVSLVSTSGSESQEASAIRDRANDQHLLGATHQPTLTKPASSVQVQMPAGMPPVHPGWQQAMSERVMWAANQQVQSATIQLDPPELGSLQVKLHIFQDQVSVTFTSPHANVRDAVEQSMPRLREMMAEQGLNLGESLVNDQSSDQGRKQREMFTDKGYGAVPEQSAEMPEESSVGLSLVDYYA